MDPWKVSFFARALSDRYGVAELPASVVFDEHNAVEMECIGAAATKVILRLPYNGEVDLVAAVSLTGAEFLVRTVWLNKRDDKHKTLDRSKYCRQ